MYHSKGVRVLFQQIVEFSVYCLERAKLEAHSLFTQVCVGLVTHAEHWINRFRFWPFYGFVQFQ